MTKQENQLVVVNEKMGSLLDEKMDACPKNFNKTRFLQNCMTVLNEVPADKLARVTPDSVALTMIKGAFLGLDFFNRECYAIPFGDKLQFLTDYKGDIKLCRQYSIKPIRNIYAKLVREGDNFECRIDEGSPIINFEPKVFSDAEIKGAFAVVVYDDLTMDYSIMSKKEIEATRQNFSKCKNSIAWEKASGEMYKKTVLKRLTKMIELDFDNAEQVKAYAEGADLKKDAIDVSPEVSDPFTKKDTKEIVQQPGHVDSIPKEQNPLTKGSDKEQIIQIKKDIEKLLNPPTKIFKLSVQLMKKPLTELTLAEMKDLQKKIGSGDV